MLPDPFADATVALDWGLSGAQAARAAGAEVAVVVDVLSFTTTVSLAMAAGAEILPYRWAAQDAERYAADQHAILARGRRAAGSGQVSLSPAAMRANVRAGDRIVLPSPNGATIAAELAATGATVIAGCLRNAGAVGVWIRDAGARRVGVVAAGERWPDGGLRPAVEDLLGAGAVLDALGPASLSVEAELARAAFRSCTDLAAAVAGCVSGRELIDGGFAADVELAGVLDADHRVPVLTGDRFRAAT